MPSTGLEVDAFEPARQILLQLYALNDAGLSPRRTDRIRRETLFFLLEGGEEQKWAWDRPHSAAARAAHRAAREARRRFPGQVEVRYDHAIPLTLLWSGLRDACRSTDALRAFVQRYVQGVVILKEEDIRLTAAGLRSTLPAQSRPDDLMARYMAIGIEFEPDDLRKLQRSSNSAAP